MNVLAGLVSGRCQRRPLDEIHIGDKFKLFFMDEVFEVKGIDFENKMVVGELHKQDGNKTISPWWILYDSRRSILFTKERRISKEVK